MISVIKGILLYLIYGCISTLVYEFWLRPKHVSKDLIEAEPRVREFVILWPFLWIGVIGGAISHLTNKR